MSSTYDGAAISVSNIRFRLPRMIQEQQSVVEAISRGGHRPEFVAGRSEQLRRLKQAAALIEAADAILSPREV